MSDTARTEPGIGNQTQKQAERNAREEVKTHKCIKKM